MSCCPENSWGELQADADYVDHGVVETVGGDKEPLEIYRTGSSSSASGKCVIWNYHIFGFQDGRSRQLADLVASKGTTLLIISTYHVEIYAAIRLRGSFA